MGIEPTQPVDFKVTIVPMRHDWTIFTFIKKCINKKVNINFLNSRNMILISTITILDFLRPSYFKSP